MNWRKEASAASCLPTVTTYGRPTGCGRLLGLELQSIPAMLRTRGQGAELDDELQAGSKIGPLTVIGVPGESVVRKGFGP
jgi:hypothetical protein